LLSNHFSQAGQTVLSPTVAMDNNGNAIIAWAQSDGTNTQIFKSEYRSGAWTDPTSLSDNISPDTQNAENPDVAMDNNGNAIITWDQLDGPAGYFQIYKREYRSGSWDPPLNLSDNISPDGEDATSPQVGMDNLGNAIIAWQQGGTVQKVLRSEYRNSAWSVANLSVPVSFTSSDAGNVQLAMDSLGNAILLWEQNDGVQTRAYVSEYRSSNGLWADPSSLGSSFSGTGPAAMESRVAMNNLGDGIIVWRN
jgi:hypothetical protein